MYSEKLEEVISAALADGNLTEQKRKIIMRRAEKEGEDVEEVMMVVESRLLNQTKKQSNQSQSKSESKEEVTNGDFVETVNGVSFKMIKVEGGRFTMFSMSQASCIPGKPQEVVLDDYYICDTVVTQELWKAVMGRNFPLLSFVGDLLPVNNLTWEESYQFINELSALTNRNYHLPSEAQWEYAAIGGKKSLGFKHAGSDDLKKVGWANVNELKPVAQLMPNELGLYDMSGNCYEFCEDNLVDNPMLNGTKNPIIRTKPTDFRIVRSTPFDSSEFSIGDRWWTPCDRRQKDYSFRIALKIIVNYRFKLIVPLTYKDVEVESEEVDLSDQEIAQIKQLVKQSPSERHGLMPILEDGAPELYDKLWNAIEQPLRDTVLGDGRKNGFVDDENDDGGLDMDCVDYLCKIPEFAK